MIVVGKSQDILYPEWGGSVSVNEHTITSGLPIVYTGGCVGLQCLRKVIVAKTK